MPMYIYIYTQEERRFEKGKPAFQENYVGNGWELPKIRGTLFGRPYNKVPTI